MTGEAGDARTEAERIVDALHDIWQRQPSEPAVTEQQVVAALAAAIEARDAYYDAAIAGDLADDDATPRRRRLAAAMSELTDALSALRARAGEETG